MARMFLRLSKSVVLDAIFFAALFIYIPIAFAMTSGPAAVVAVVVLWVALMVGIAMLDYFVLSYRCSECGLKFTRHELAARDRS